MYQNLVSNAPTPIFLLNQNVKPTGGSTSSVGYVISNTVGSGVFRVTGLSVSYNTYNGFFVQASQFRRCVFGGKFSLASSSASSVSAMWCVIDMATTSTPGQTPSLSGVRFYPFESSCPNSGSDTFSIDTTPTGPSNSVYVGIVFLGNGSDLAFDGVVSISQYVKQEAFFQPMKG